MSLFAHLEPARAKSERRSSRRRKLRLELERSATADLRVVIHDLSEQGMLLETDAQLAVGEAVELVIPGAWSTEAVVMWNCGCYFGCRFEKPLTTAAVSAAQLQSPSPLLERTRKRAIYNAMAELRSLAGVVEQITDQVERAIVKINSKRG
jgi:hypothetical protein